MSTTAPEMNDLARPPRVHPGWLVLGLGSMCSFITSLNQSIMSVAFADLRKSFPDVPASQLSWILNVYTIVSGATLIISAVLSNRYGRKRMLLTGLSVFAAAGLLCTLATGPPMLIAGRAVQAIGWSLITPSAVAVVLSGVPPGRRASAIATWAGIGGIATSLGPSLGAVIIDLGSWRMAFLASVPFAVFVIVVGAKVFTETPPEDLVHERFPDMVGVASLLFGMTLFILGLVETASWGWVDRRTFACLIAGLALLGFLLWRSTKVERPTIDPRLMRYRNIRLAVMMSIGWGTCFFATSLGLVLFLTQVWDYSVVRAGALITPIAASVTVLSPFAGRIADRFGHRVLVVPGGMFWLSGALWLLLGAGRSPDLPGVWFPATLLLGVGSGLSWPAIHGIPILGVDAKDFAAAVATNQTVLRIVGSLGIAIAVTLVSGTTGASSIAPFRHLFVFMAVGGVLLSCIGTLIRTSPSHASPDLAV